MKIKKTIVLFLAALFFPLLAYCGQGKVLESSLAGSWYPADSGKLSILVNKYLDNVKEKRLNDIIALILPHAGYQYSGQTAAYGVKELKGKKYSRVIIIGLNHHSYMRNEACIPNVSAFKTPLGKIPLDTEFIKKFEKDKHVITGTQFHALEHTIQIQLPLLQKVLGQFKLVPIIVGQLDKITARKIATALHSIIDDNTLIIASSDFTHYGKRFQFLPFPLNFQTEANIKKLDMGAVKEIKNNDFEGFYNYVDKTGTTICGSSPILILLAMLPKNSKQILLHYDTSGNQLKNFSNSISYVTIASTGKWSLKKNKINDKTKKKAILTKADKKNLLKLARKTLVYCMKHKKDANTKRAWNYHHSRHETKDGGLCYAAQRQHAARVHWRDISNPFII